MKRLLIVTVLAACVLSWPTIEAQRPVFGTGTPAEIAQAQAIGLDHVRTLAERKGIDRAEDLVVGSAHVDRLAMAHTRIQQRYRGVPVWGGEAIAHITAAGEVFGETDNLLEGVSVSPTPRLQAAEAIAIATSDYGCADCLTGAPSADLWIVRDEAGVDHLAYRVQMQRFDRSAGTAMPVRFVDAHGGYVVLAYDNLQTGTGNSLYSGTVSFGTFNNTTMGSYVLENLGVRLGTFDDPSDGNVYPWTDSDDVWNHSSQRAAVDAHYGAEKVFEYFQSVLGRNGINGSGGPFTRASSNGSTTLVSSVVIRNASYNNAYWNGSSMVYGDGDGVNFGPLVTLDIAGHEMMHGVTQFEAGLIYNGESGALNESWSDVFGAMVERFVRGESADTWLIGEQAYTPGTSGDALRYMQDPHLASNAGFTSDDDPDHYSERYTGILDNGGVHINSGIANKAFFLLANGGTHHLGGSMTGIGADPAAQIRYLALSSYMTSNTNFAGARTATVNAAGAIFGSTHANVRKVEMAWCLVGVGSCPDVADVEAISVTPGSGSGVTQTFAFAYSDSLGVTADLTAAQVRFVPSDSGTGVCTIHYRATTGQVRMQDDAGVWGAWTSFGAGSLTNSSCSLNLVTSTAVPSGTNLTLNLAVTFTASFGGPKNIAMRATSAGGATTGWVTRGTWTVGGVVQAISATPNSGTGGAQAFAFAFSDSLGATADLKQATVRIGASNVAGGVCTIQYNAMTAQVRIQDDAGVSGTWKSFGAGMGTISNSQCTLNLETSSASPSGNNLTLNLNLAFSTTFGGTKNIYMRGNSSYGSTSDWQIRGTWTVGAAVDAVSITPPAGTGVTQLFTALFSDSLGAAADLQVARVRFAGATGPQCVVDYNAMTNTVRIQNDAAGWDAAVAMGSANTLSNSQCSLNVAQSSAVPSGNDLTLALRLTFKAGFLGAKTISGRANSHFGSTSGWESLGTYTVDADVDAVSVTPNTGSGTTQAFVLAYTDSAGVAADLKVARVRVQGAGGGAQCTIDYNAMTDQVRIMLDSGLWSAFVPFGSGELTNSQCTLNLTQGGGVRSGTNLTLTVHLTFKAGFTGMKNIAMRANSNVGPTTDWQVRGTWTP